VGINRSAKTLSVKKIRQRTMIIAGRFETDQRWRTELAQVADQPLVLLQRVGHAKTAPLATTLAQLNQHLVVVLGDVDRYQNRGLRPSVTVGHGG
jgi:hypothetical protein